jgi:steroid delta-isomerase-like uncharacterized protein
MDTIQIQEESKATVCRIYDEILNTGRLELLGEIISDDFINAQGMKGPDGFAQIITSLRHAFPDIKWEIEDLIAEGDKVVVRWTWTGTNSGSFRGFPVSNKKVTDHAIAIYQFKDNKVVQAWLQTDRLGFLVQIGVIPPDILTPASQTGTESRQMLIDKFFVPKNAVKAFTQQMNANRVFIHQLPGFISDEVLKQEDKEGNLTIITIARWQNQTYIDSARQKVQQEHSRIGFNRAEFTQRLNIKMERGLYQELSKNGK